jgi:hypothetical protein
MHSCRVEESALVWSGERRRRRRRPAGKRKRRRRGKGGGFCSDVGVAGDKRLEMFRDDFKYRRLNGPPGTMVQSDHTVPVPGLDLKPKHGTMGLFYFFKNMPEQFFFNKQHMTCAFLLI